MGALGRFTRRQASNAVRLSRKLGQRSVFPDDRAIWLDVKLGSHVAEAGVGFTLGTSHESHLGLLELLRSLRAAASDDRITGVLFRFEGELTGWSQTLAIRRLIDDLRENHKRCVLWAPDLSTPQYLIASACDQIWLPMSGSLRLLGLRTEQLFARDVLQKWDVVPEIIHIGKYKSAGELLTRDSMSEEQREQIENWQRDIFEEVLAGVSLGRGLRMDEVRTGIDRGPYPAADAVEANLIDRCLYPDEIDAALAGLAPEELGHGQKIHRLKVQQYSRLHGTDSGWQPLFEDLPRVAYVTAIGALHRGYGNRGIAHERYGKLIDQLRESKFISGVVLRVDSPGGDALASDLLHRSIERLAQSKPTVVSMGNVAASGGYYISAAAHSIYAEAGSLTGSIGVVGGKLNLSGLYRKLGIAKDSVEFGSRAGIDSDMRSFTDDEHSAIVRGMESVYELFLERVASGRGLTREAVREVAEGRIWSGRQASSLGLVDALGGPLEALEEVRRRIGLGEHEAWNLELQPRRTPFSGINELLQSLTGGG